MVAPAAVPQPVCSNGQTHVCICFSAVIAQNVREAKEYRRRIAYYIAPGNTLCDGPILAPARLHSADIAGRMHETELTGDCRCLRLVVLAMLQVNALRL